ncbi:MAG: tetratricopeptide repeat protein [Synechococcus sp.]
MTLKAEQALLFLQQGDLEQAESLYRQLLHVDSLQPDANLYLGAIAVLQARWAEAEVCFRTALSARPDDADALTLLGNALLQLGQIDEAMHCQSRALALAPDMPEAHRGLGDVWRVQADCSQAIASYERALTLRPDFPQAAWNLATTLLLAGEYQRGWALYSTRFSACVGVRPIARPSVRQWWGEPLLPGQRLLLVAEQGLGDTLQFMRYLHILEERGIQVCLDAQPPLHNLLKASGIRLESSACFDADSTNDDGLWAPLLSLPGFLEVGVERPLLTRPYVHSVDDLVRRWRLTCSGQAVPIIAIHWQGNPAVEVANLSGRSLPLEAFACVSRCASVRLLSLQKGFGAEQLITCSFRQCFVDSQVQVDQAWDFLETVAILANTDLLITSDSAVAHLAGAMGHPTWLLLHHVPDWRWGLEGDTTFWYPSMRLFRQREPGNWDELMQRVATALQDYVAARSS